MTELREKTRHHHKLLGDKQTDIASLLKLPDMDALKLWNLTAHNRKSVIQEVRPSFYLSKLALSNTNCQPFGILTMYNVKKIIWH